MFTVDVKQQINQSINRRFVKMPPIKFRERLTKFMISMSLSEKFCCQNLITRIKVINMTRNSSKSNKLVGWLVVLGLTALSDSISVYIGPSPKEREKEERKDR